MKQHKAPNHTALLIFHGFLYTFAVIAFVLEQGWHIPSRSVKHAVRVCYTAVCAVRG